MVRNRFLPVLVLALSALLATVLALPGRAYAGTLQVRDEAHILTPDAVARLRSVVAGTPFDARLVFTPDYAEPEELSRYVGSLVREPNMVAVGVDPQHRHVEVHFGVGTGIARAKWNGIERAGDEAFRGGNWEGGAATIFKTAAQAVSGAPLGSGAPLDDGGRVAQPQGSSRIGSGLVIFLIVLGVVGAFAFFGRRRSANGGYGSGYGPPPGYGPGYGGGPYAGGPGYGPPPAQGMGPLGGGIIGAGLGGLAGYELGKVEGEREEREERDRDRGEGDRGAPDGNFDAGGGGSDWGDDNGGGGGGFDGGGGDSGGGGGDF